jgi:hypothetical protein
LREIVEADAQMVDTGQIQQEMVLKCFDLWLFLINIPSHVKEKQEILLCSSSGGLFKEAKQNGKKLRNLYCRLLAITLNPKPAEIFSDMIRISQIYWFFDNV